MDYAAAFALAVSGDVSRSRALADDLARDYPEDTSVQYMYLPTLRALFSLNAHDAAAAIQTLQTASRFDLGMGGIGIIGHFGRLYPIYVRGQAYLAAHQPAEAAAEFQRILDHRSIVLVDPMDAMARLQLARALALSGDTVKAKSAYNDLLDAVGARRPQDPDRRGSTGGIRPAAVSVAFHRRVRGAELTRPALVAAAAILEELVSGRGTLGGLTRFTVRSDESLLQAVDSKDGEMAEWLKAHAWKAISATLTERHGNTSLSNQFKNFPRRHVRRCDAVSDDIRRSIRAHLTQFLHSLYLDLARGSPRVARAGFTIEPRV